MPSLKKRSLSLYIRTGCRRQLALYLYNDKERRANGMPPRQQVRAGLGQAGAIGYAWQDEKVGELADLFGRQAVHVSATKNGNRPAAIALADVLPRLQPYQFVVEGQYDAQTPTFMQAVGIATLVDLAGNPLTVGDALPDLIQALPPAATPAAWEVCLPDGGPPPTMQAIRPDGNVAPLALTDQRLRLRVIDIKLSSEPGAHYFAEVVYYSMTLAAWLEARQLTHAFVVVAAPAVWPGSYDASQIRQLHNQCRKEGREPSSEDLARALEDDIEVAPVDAFAPRLRRFFQEELPQALQTPWDQLPWHVSYICKGCEFLGFPWGSQGSSPTNAPAHCWPTAERTGHLSRVAGLSRSGATLLGARVADIGALAALPTEDPVFGASPSLRAKRTIYPHRAQALASRLSTVIPDSGGDALMPAWPDLHVYLFVDYDVSSAITASFGIRAFWKEPLPFNSPHTPATVRWRGADGATGLAGPPHQEVYLVDRRDLDREREELLKFLRALRGILKEVERRDDHDAAAGRRGDVLQPASLKRSTYQIYLWDEAQRKHLVRNVGRHLVAILADPQLRDLVWLFPPPEVLTHAEEASYKSPFTFVSTVVQNTLAVPVPHHYTLLDVVNAYHHPSAPTVQVHPLYYEPLSDLIPGERLHEMWTRHGNYTRTQRIIEETTGKKVGALAFVTAQLERDLKGLLSRAAAPPVGFSRLQLTGVPSRSALWYEYTRLNQAMEELDEQTLRAMPAHEREARFKSAHLVERLEGDDKLGAYDTLRQMVQQPLDPAAELLIYRLNPNSREFNVRPPALGFALAPRGDPAFLGRSAYPLVKDHNIPRRGKLAGSVAEAGLTRVSVVAIDRVRCVIALKPWRTTCVLELERAGLADFRADVMLDPAGEDFISKKLSLTLQGIGRPASAGDDSRALRALGWSSTADIGAAPETPASEFLWQAPLLAATSVERDVARARAHLEGCGVALNNSQWEAWAAALTRRLALIWGPPGTGKSQALRAIIVGAAWLAHAQRRPLRVLIASNTYTAIDNVLLDVDAMLLGIVGQSNACRLFRLQSQYHDPPVDLEQHPAIELVIVKTVEAPPEVQELQALLEAPDGVVVVAGPPQQLHNLAIATKNRSAPKRADAIAHTQRRWFDLIVVDEASQLGVAEATLVVSKAADGAAFVLAGDDKQLPPIQPATPPEGLEHVVGSVYNYARHHHDVAPLPLQINYRSNRTLVEFTKRAGYDPGLRAYHPDLRLGLLAPGLPTARPADWPAHLHWNSSWAELLDPAYPATCFIYDDDVAGLSNAFEADAVAALLWLLYGRLDQQLMSEQSGNGLLPLTGRSHSEKTFWEQAVGVVTPHRAQMSMIVGRLHATFPAHSPTAIWGAVDTVERFQGQQRDVIVASFGLGDPDLIRSEDEFLYSLNRFNVMASRARAKLIVLLTRTVVDHLADDGAVLEESRLLKSFAESFCHQPIEVTLGVPEHGMVALRPGILRRR